MWDAATDLEHMLHSLVQGLGAPGARRGGQAQDLRESGVSPELRRDVAPHDLVVDLFLAGVVTLVDDQQSNVWTEGKSSPFYLYRP